MICAAAVPAAHARDESRNVRRDPILPILLNDKLKTGLFIPMQNAGVRPSRYDLTRHGLRGIQTAYWNLGTGQLIERAIPNATVRREFARDGVVCTIEAQLPKALGEGS